MVVRGKGAFDSGPKRKYKLDFALSCGQYDPWLMHLNYATPCAIDVSRHYHYRQLMIAIKEDLVQYMSS
jgi:hypothetical protein